MPNGVVGSPIASAVAAWWDASDASTLTITAANGVSAWKDKIGGLSAVQATAVYQPAYSATARNGKPGLTVTSTIKGMSTADSGSLPLGNTGNTIIVVGELVAATSAAAAMSYGTTAAHRAIYLGSAGTVGVDAAGTTASRVIGTATWMGVDRIAVGNFNPTSLSVYADGASSGALATATALATTAGPVYLFGDATGGRTFRGTIQEIFIFNRVLTDAERQTMEGYCAWKWGLQANLPTTHPYYAAAPTTNLPTPDANLGSVTGIATGKLTAKGIVGSESSVLGAITGAATGNASIEGQAAPTLGRVMSSGTGVSPRQAKVNKTLGAVVSEAEGSLSVAGVAAGTLDAISGLATGTVSEHIGPVPSPDLVLPVWSIKPNWKDGVTETLEWYTDIITGTDGSEQRRNCRVSPRRSFEYTANPIDNERTFMDLLLEQMATATLLLPLWHDKGRADADAAAGSLRLDFDNAYREHVVGNLAIVYINAFTYQVIQVVGVDDGGLDLMAPGLTAPVRKGQAIYPLRRAFISDKGSYSSLSPRVGQAQLKFQIDGPNDIIEGAEVLPLIDGSPLFTKQPEWSGGIAVTLTTLDFSVDSMTGLTYRESEVLRSFSSQAWSAFAVGRAQQFALRQMLYRQRGRSRDLWMPTYNRDITLASPAFGGQALLDIGKIGLEFVGGPLPGRNRILFPSTGETALISGMGAAPVPTSERLVLSAPLGADYPKGAVATFLDRCRFNSDLIEIDHAVDSDGPINVKIPIKAFSDTREATLPINYPIPIAAMSDTPCGTPEDGSCTTTFDGWFWKLTYNIARTGGDPNSANMIDIIQGLPDDTPVDTTGSPNPAGTWNWVALINADVAPGTALTWVLDTECGLNANCTALWPDTPTPQCVGTVYAQHWTMANAVLVSQGPHYCHAVNAPLHLPNLDGSLPSGVGEWFNAS